METLSVSLPSDTLKGRDYMSIKRRYLQSLNIGPGGARQTRSPPSASSSSTHGTPTSSTTPASASTLQRHPKKVRDAVGDDGRRRAGSMETRKAGHPTPDPVNLSQTYQPEPVFFPDFVLTTDDIEKFDTNFVIKPATRQRAATETGDAFSKCTFDSKATNQSEPVLLTTKPTASVAIATKSTTRRDTRGTSALRDSIEQMDKRLASTTAAPVSSTSGKDNEVESKLLDNEAALDPLMLDSNDEEEPRLAKGEAGDEDASADVEVECDSEEEFIGFSPTSHMSPTAPMAMPTIIKPSIKQQFEGVAVSVAYENSFKVGREGRRRGQSFL